MTNEGDVARGISDVVAALRDAKERNQPCSVLIGAGCSASAGIPTAAGIVKELEGRYEAAFRRAKVKDYPNVMREVDTGPRYRLIGEYVERARLNWAHILLAWLVKNGFVGRILTTNFDNLTLRACSLYGVNAAVYDLAATSLFKPSFVRDPAVFFLHGQHAGFVQLHTRDEVEQNAKLLRPAFENATFKRTWIVVGYSGTNDPVFENLSAISEFADGLYWVGFRDELPSEDVRERLLTRGRQAYLVQGYDADGFFLEVFRQLKLPAPPFLTDPFSHLLEILGTFTSFPTDDAAFQTDITHRARRWLQEARAHFVGDGAGATAGSLRLDQREAAAFKLFAEGKFDAVIGLRKPGEEVAPGEFRAVLGSAYSKRARQLQAGAEKSAGTTALKMFAEAANDFALAAEYSSNKPLSLNSWAVCLMRWSAVVDAAESKALLARAEELLMGILQIDANNWLALYNRACICAQRRDVSETLVWLRRRQNVAPVLLQDQLKNDRAFDGIRNFTAFQKLVDDLGAR